MHHPMHLNLPSLLFISLLSATLPVMGQDVVTLPLWPGTAPGDTGDFEQEADMSKPSEGLVAGKPLIRLGNVSQPTIAIYRPTAAKNTGAAVLVCPGGGYGILALDLEGSEVCEWLNSIGVTGVLLKYRVPARKDRARHDAPLQDVQRAMGMIRSHATEWGVRKDRIGILGFSAGGHLAAVASTTYERRTYDRVDQADEESARPDFAALIYPAYLTTSEKPDVLVSELNVTVSTPPTFTVITQDDPVRVENAYTYSLALKKAGVASELHVFAKGGHGYGLRKTDSPVTIWPAMAEAWMRDLGMLKRD